MNQRSRQTLYLALTTTALIWGAGFAVARFALRSVSPLQLLAAQSLVAAVAQIAWSAARGDWRQLRLRAPLFWPLVALGLVGQNILNGLVFFGLAHTTATNAALIFGFSPVMIGILAAMFLREPWGARHVLGALAGFAGVAIIITQGHPEAIRLQGLMLGNLLSLGGAFYWSSYSVVTRGLAQRVAPEVYTFYIITLGSLGPIVWVWANEGRFPLAGLELPTLLAATFMGVGTGTLGMNLWSWGLAQIEASRVGVFSYLEPVFAAAVAMTFLGERLTLPTAVGAALVFAGIFLSTSSSEMGRAAGEN